MSRIPKGKNGNGGADCDRWAEIPNGVSEVIKHGRDRRDKGTS
jgi:hypothetical protein